MDKLMAVTPLQLTVAAVLLLALVLSTFLSGSKAKAASGPRTVLFVGPLAAGKTALFSKLLYGHAPPTHTSMKENEGAIKLRWSPEEVTEAEKGTKEATLSQPIARGLTVVDIPGHPRLRTRALAQVLPSADGVVFLVDAVAGLSGKNVRDAGEHLHVVLSLLALYSQTSSSPPSLLILLTKSDLLPSCTSSKSLSLTLDRAKSTLAREMERRRLASVPANGAGRIEGLEAIPSTVSSSFVKDFLAALGLGPKKLSTGIVGGLPTDEAEVLGTEAFAFEGTFSWENLETKIDWAVSSTKGGQGGVEQVWDWVDSL